MADTKKLKNLKLKNFGKFTDFEIEFDSKITRLVGRNGDGKTTVGLTAIWAGIKGISENDKGGSLVGERFRFIGKQGKSADVELTLVDEERKKEITIHNHITEASNKITFNAPEGYPLGEDWLKNLLSVAFLSAKNFSQLDSKKQALLLGIDTATYDAAKKKLGEEYTFINRQLKDFGTLTVVDKCETVSVSDLLKQKEEIDTFNRQQDAKQDALDEIIGEGESLVAEIEELKKQIKAKEALHKARIAELKASPKPEEKKSADKIMEAIQNAEATNRQASAYEQYLAQSEKKSAKEKELAAIKAKGEKNNSDRLAFIQGFKFGFNGVSVDDNGGLLLNERPIKEPYFSRGELEVIVAKIYASMNPELKVRFIDDFETLDADNQTKLVDALLKDGFQIITAEVGEASTKENVVILRQCAIASGEQGKMELL